MPGHNETGKPGPTAQLSSWIAGLGLADIPPEIVTRAKYLMLDGIGCGLVNAHLPWSERAAHVLFALEPAGDATVFGWNRTLPPLSASLLNSSFIQGFEIDDWHSEAPLHSNAILLPALLAASQHVETASTPTSGADLLLATVVGFETGPRVGLGLHGTHILTTGWHSGAVFGPAAAAAAVSKLLNLNADQIEDAFGTACTQACGLMSAQFGSEVKRMQHGFAARNGLLAAFLARGGYTGIRGVFEEEYGGFLKQFSAGNGKTPQYRPEEIAKELGTAWKTHGVRVKPYAAMAATHPSIDCVRALQEQHGERLRDLAQVHAIRIEMDAVSHAHGGFAVARPLAATGAQMSCAFVAATQLVHGAVLPAQFRAERLEDEDVWRVVERTTCVLSPPDTPFGRHTVTVTLADGSVLAERRDRARGVDPPLSNAEIVDKYRALTASVMDGQRAREIEALVLGLEEVESLQPLHQLLAETTNNPIA